MVQPPKPPPGEARADQAGQILRQLDHQVGLDATALEILAIAPVRLGHEPAHFGQVALFQGLFGGNGAQVLADDVARAEQGLGLHLVAPLLQIVEGGVAQKGNAATVAVDDGAGGFGLATAGGIVAPGNGVLDHGVGDDQRDVGGNGGQLEAQVAAIEEQGVVLLAVGGDELVHDAAIGAHKLVLDTLAEASEHRAGNGDPMSEVTASMVTTSRAAELERPEPRGTSPHRLRLKPGIL